MCRSDLNKRLMRQNEVVLGRRSPFCQMYFSLWGIRQFDLLSYILSYVVS